MRPARLIALIVLAAAWLAPRARAADDTAPAAAAAQDALRDAQPGPVTRLGWGKTSLAKDGTLLLQVNVWPNGADLVLPIANDPAAVRFLTDKAIDPPEATRQADGLHIGGMPKAAPAKLPIVISLSFGPAGPKAIDNSIKQSADGALSLLATTGELHATNAKLEKKGDRPYNIGYWTNVKDYVTWDTPIDHPGKFAVVLEYSLAPSCAGSEIDIEFGKPGTPGATVLPVKLPAGKDFLDFQTLHIGQVTVPPGPITITLRPAKKPGGAVMDLRRIDLKPAAPPK